MPATRSNRRTGRAAGILTLIVLFGCGGGGERPAADTAGSAGAVAAAPAAPAAAGGGEALYQRCVTCHQPNGEGMAGNFPPLAGSEYATASNVAVPIRIVLHGMQGPVTVKGVEYNGVMPAYGTGQEMSDDEVASVLTYVRQSWGNSASAVTAAQVAAERAASRSAAGPVTAQELRPLL